jgi:hypothetical protein
VVSDARAQQAREHHRAAGAAPASARRPPPQPDALVRRLRAEDPARWSYGALAGAVGCSPELIRVILTGDPRKRCKRCKGLGVIPDFTKWDDYHGEPKPIPCPDCGGQPSA